MRDFKESLAAELAALNESHAGAHVLQMTLALDGVSDLADVFNQYSHSNSCGSYVVSSGILPERIRHIIISVRMRLIRKGEACFDERELGCIDR